MELAILSDGSRNTKSSKPKTRKKRPGVIKKYKLSLGSYFVKY